MIPPRIICTNVSAISLDKKLKYCLHRMRELHPEWEILFFSDGDCEEFVKTRAEVYWELYQWYPRPVLKADLFRLLAVSKLGGFYLDTDLLLSTRLDPLLEHSAVFPWEHVVNDQEFDIRYPAWMRTRERRKTVANYAFGAEAGHPFLDCILDELVVRTFSIEAERCNDLDVLHATGPDAVTTVYYREEDRWAETVTMLPPQPQSGLGPYGVHLVHSSWRE
jgi:mannosyltransferase OCH1-like enzyme